MTDEQIVRTLAAFEGWHVLNDGTCISPSRVYRQELEDFRYLTSYDALAEVWRKLCFNAPISNDAIAVAAMNSLRIKYGVSDWGMWFTATPKEVAEALATAIASAKETGAA